MLSGIVGMIVTAILNWLAKLIGVQIGHAVDKAVDEKKNDDIEKGLEGAKTEQEAQDALNKAAGHLGRNP